MWRLNEMLAPLMGDVSQDFSSIVIQGAKSNVLGIDMSIENVSSQGYSYFIFGFLVLSLIVFSFIIYLYLPKGKDSLKKAEKIMIGAIIAGVVLAFIIGWFQLIEGYLV